MDSKQKSVKYTVEYKDGQKEHEGGHDGGAEVMKQPCEDSAQRDSFVQYTVMLTYCFKK